MRLDRVLRALFVLYCAEAGALLVFLPWSGMWDRLLFQLPWLGLDVRTAAVGTLARSVVCAFGVVHLVWAAQDLQDWVARRASPQ